MVIAVFSNSPKNLRNKIIQTLKDDDRKSWNTKIKSNKEYFYHVGQENQWEDILLSVDILKNSTVVITTKSNLNSVKDKECYVIGRCIEMLLRHINEINNIGIIKQ